MDLIDTFFDAKTFAVAGASSQPHKYGNQIFRALLSADFETYPLNPTQSVVEGHIAYNRISELPVVPESLSIITPPKVTREIVGEAIELGVKHIWMQPGAQDDQASDAARRHGISVIADGSCLLVLLARR